jgi:histidinol-phosphatase (PHP family)
MRYLSDYHIHTSFSHDCDTPMVNQCQAALNAGLSEVAFTDHVEYDPHHRAHGYFRPGAYFAGIEQCRARFDKMLVIRAGIEIGQPHRCKTVLQNLQDQYAIDFIIGSIHMVDGRNVTHESYPEGHTENELYSPYFGELIEMAKFGDYDVIGHLDICKRFGSIRYGLFDAQAYADLIREALQTAIERGRGIEINCSGLRHSCGETYPALQVLTWYRELGGRILTIGADSHSSEHIGVGLEEGRSVAQRAGFEAVTVFEGRQPRWVPLV